MTAVCWSTPRYGKATGLSHETTTFRVRERSSSFPITVYRKDASGDVAPLRIIRVQDVDDWPTSIAVHPIVGNFSLQRYFGHRDGL